ncbi:MAG: class I SAM-dependent methyltransferase [Proteobacteria bacterium]|nr:class I SAM-dependent methyltransferase [Pseudomonadota bacterium]
MHAPAYQRYLRKPFLGSSHSWAKRQSTQAGLPERVLDIGSGSGVMAQELRELGVRDLYAVETDPETRAHTASLYTQISDSIQSYVGQQFDLVLLLDVLEHIPDPLSCLREVLPLVAPGGRLLFSVPNVAHWSVRLPLLFGQFQYRDRGILDRTHLHFYTRRTFQELLENLPELAIESEAVSIPPVEFLVPQWVWSSAWFKAVTTLHNSSAQLLPGLLGYQLLTVASKRTSDAQTGR